MVLKQEIDDMKSETAGDRLMTALELADAGILLMRQNLKRKWPSDTEEEIDERLQAWLIHRRGSELGDGPQFLRVRSLL